MSDKKLTFKVAGVHVAGPNSAKTAMAVLGGPSLRPPWHLIRLYPRIAPMVSVFSDERLLDIVRLEQPIAALFVDCPLTVPPCVACKRPVCPGAWRCEDLTVAYMLSLSEKIREKHKKKRRIINPQAQRLWDVLNIANHDTPDAEPSYSSNLAPLVVRATTLQRRLMSLEVPQVIRETSVPIAIKSLAIILGLPQSFSRDFRNFDGGRKSREDFLLLGIKKGLIAPFQDPQMTNDLTGSIENFQALITALVAAAFAADLCAKPPSHMNPDDGWVHIPVCDIPSWGPSFNAKG